MFISFTSIAKIFVSAPSASFVGGILGQCGASASITNSYSTGTVSGSASVGGLVGNACSVTSSYWDQTTSGMGTNPSGTGYVTGQMQNQANFSGWDFSSIWQMVGANSYPSLR